MITLVEIDPATKQSVATWCVEKKPKKLDTNVYVIPDKELKVDTGIYKLDGSAIKALSVAEVTTMTKAMEQTAMAADCRMHRNLRLSDSDWVVTKALEKGETVPKAWSDYRTALRDLPTHSKWPELQEADWPVVPS